ncbi:MAG: threonine ammonia-lyase IlvA [Streptococcaceae bacterium]|jgi:threonine dehydratase|nr:threonine ammonia-lyase IlvA [Streptococcaceae bacterium]MCH4177486.1 threonine ammonia-lyase IlvA [Streptococcaceae bacterium]
MVSKESILYANFILKDLVTHTPLQHDRYLSEKYNANIYLKREDLQKVRSFKLRGAAFAIKNLPKEKLENGVVCASAGNHAQGVAYTCAELKIPAFIFMPTTTPHQKISQVEFFGGSDVEVILTGDTFDQSANAAQAYAEKEHKTFIAPFDDEDVISGQGTVALEVFEDAEKKGIQVDEIITAIGGGGLISGIATYTKETHPEVKVIGTEPLGALSMKAAFDAGKPVKLDEIDKFADGVAVQKVGDKTFEIAQKYIDQLVGVDEGQIASTIIELYTKQAIVVEPAGALSVATLETIKDQIKGKTVVCIISGGNNDINRMNEIEERALIFEGLKHYFVVNFPQRPGALRELVSDILGPNDDITRFEYIKKNDRGKGPALVGVLLKSNADYAPLVKRMRTFDPKFIDLNKDETLYSLLV